MEGQPITTNPVLIMLINMTIVFSVLVLLGLLIELIHRIDPTKSKKKAAPKAPPVQAKSPVSQAVPDVPAIDEAALAMEEKTIKAVITTAIMVSGYKEFEIVSIRKID